MVFLNYLLREYVKDWTLNDANNDCKIISDLPLIPTKAKHEAYRWCLHRDSGKIKKKTLENCDLFCWQGSKSNQVFESFE